MGFASHSGFQVVTGRANRQASGRVAALLEPLEVTVGMPGLAFGGGAEQCCNVVLAFDVGLVRKIQITAVGLRFARKGGFQVVFRLGAFKCCHGNLLEVKKRKAALN